MPKEFLTSSVSVDSNNDARSFNSDVLSTVSADVLKDVAGIQEILLLPNETTKRSKQIYLRLIGNSN